MDDLTTHRAAPRTRTQFGPRPVALILYGGGPDRLVTPKNADLGELMGTMPDGSATRSRRVPGAWLVRTEHLPDLDAMAEVLGWFVVRQAAPRATRRQTRKGRR